MGNKICVIGGGASGMVCAIEAAKNNADVTLLEQTDRVGRKLLLTGNGKCNLTNLELHPSDYASDSPMVGKILAACDQYAVMRFFEAEGMRLKVLRERYVYPETEHAATVVNVLRRSLRRYRVEVRTKEAVRRISPLPSGYLVTTGQGEQRYDRVVLACGGASFPKTGSDGSGFALAKELCLLTAEPYPALTALLSPKEDLRILSGLRWDAGLSLFVDGERVCGDRGQVQFTDYGVSGIPVFQLSLAAAPALREGKEVALAVDFFPELDEAQLREALQRQWQSCRDFPFEEAMAGFLHKKQIDYFVKRYRLQTYAALYEVPAKLKKELWQELSVWKLPVTGTKGYDFCQVTGGGVMLSQLDESCQIKKLPGLFVTGEMLDVVGACGGYNLQWAFSTGILAGRAAAAP